MLTLLLGNAYSQQKETQLTVSGGYVSFGSGDFLGYYLGIGASRQVNKKPSAGLNKLLLGGELIFENGTKNPVVYNPTVSEFLQTFHHVSTSMLWVKASYYPLNKILRGLNIQLGPTIGYSYRSSEGWVASRPNVPVGVVRESRLSYDNGVIYGYRISAALDFRLTNKLFTGLRMDFSNTQKGEINNSLGAKIGFVL